MSDAPPEPPASDSDDEYVRQRRDKAAWLRDELGVDPFWGSDARPTHRAAAIHADYGGRDEAALAAEPVEVGVAGRVTALRRFGKAGFADLRDGSGKIQIHFQKDALDERDFAIFKQALDLGDFVAARGVLFRTRTGELTVRAGVVDWLSKALRGLPEKWHGLSDVETRTRQRYLDLIANDESRERFLKRSRMLQEIRQFFVERDFLEVETPMLHGHATGAAARPFTTHHNALGLDLVLRVAPELHLKRLVVGGMDRVFELNRNFRNEGISIQHNPEFTMLEFYQAYADVDDLLQLSEALLARLAVALCGSTDVTYQGEELRFAAPFRRATVRELLIEHAGMSDVQWTEPEAAAHFCLGHRVAPGKIVLRLLEGLDAAGTAAVEAACDTALVDAQGSFTNDKNFRDQFIAAVAGNAGDRAAELAGGLAYLVFEDIVEPKLIQPTFVRDFPIMVSPLARRVAGQPALADRFELFIYGREIANGFRELNDPDDQRARFYAQERMRALGDLEAMEIDEDYLRALEHGLPPTSGEGIGIDRLCMLLTDAASIRDVLLFPALRPKNV